MVKIRDDLPKAADGSIDIETWVARVGQNRLRAVCVRLSRLPGRPGLSHRVAGHAKKVA